MVIAVTAGMETDEEQRDLRVLATALRRVDVWLPRSEPGGWTVRPGSPLAGDDKKSDPFHVSHAVASAVQVAVDHACALRRLVEGCDACHPQQMTFLLNSYYTLVRGALENAARAVWLLAPGSRPERILRRLRLQADNVVNSDQAASAMGSSMPQSRAVRLGRVREIAARAGVNADQAVQRPGSKEVVQAAGHYIGGDDAANHIETLWRACSGAAHGDVWAGLSLHDREVVAATGNVATTRFTVATHLFTTFLTEAFAVIDVAHGLFDYRNRPLY